MLEQAIWVLGNFAGEGAPSRDAVLSHGALQPLVACLLARSGSGRSGGGYGCSLSLLRIGSWALSNLCDGQPRPVWVHIKREKEIEKEELSMGD